MNSHTVLTKRMEQDRNMGIDLNTAIPYAPLSTLCGTV